MFLDLGLEIKAKLKDEQPGEESLMKH